MMPRSEVVALIALAALCVIGVIICAVEVVNIPAVLGDLAFVAVGGGAGAVLPSRTTVSAPAPVTTTTTTPPQ